MEKHNVVAVVRVRGLTGVSADARETLKLLGLTRVNHCVLVRGTPQSKGMIERVKDFVTWGEPTPAMVATLVEHCGRLAGDKRLTGALLKAAGFDSFEAFAAKLLSGEATAASVPGMKKVFRLSPPRKGYRSVKRAYPAGALGNRGAEMDGLLKRMARG